GRAGAVARVAGDEPRALDPADQRGDQEEREADTHRVGEKRLPAPGEGHRRARVTRPWSKGVSAFWRALSTTVSAFWRALPATVSAFRLALRPRTCSPRPSRSRWRARTPRA